MRDLLGVLHAAAGERLGRAYAPKSKGPLQAAIRALAKFAKVVPRRQLFVASRFVNDKAASVHNEWTLILLVEWMLRTPSAKTKKPVKAGTIESYVSLLKGYLVFSYDFEIAERAPRLTRLIALIRSDDPTAGMRGKRRGFRRRHLRKLWRMGGVECAESADAAARLAALGTAWHVLARGGEICPTGVWDAGKHPTRADLLFRRRQDGTRYAILWLRPLKKRGQAAAAKVPQYIEEADGGGSDVYMLLRRMLDLDPVAPAEAALTPLFRLSRARGAVRHMTVAHLRQFTRNCARRLGFTVRKQWGAHSGRIGGATDLAATGSASQVLLQAKGRWASDIGRIYARMTRRSQLAASRLMQRARGRDLEELIPDFTQGY